ncbi:MAG: GGDEF domain-containing protein [Pseudomonadota bacterium]
MSAAAPQTETNDLDSPPVSARTQIFQTCQAAFQQIQEYDTPPDPITYALWYAYVSYQPPGVRQDMDKLIASGRKIDAYELTEIYNSHFQTSELEDTNEAIGREMEDNLENVSKMLESGIEQNTHFQNTLSHIQDAPLVTAPQDEFKSMIDHLVVESQKVSAATLRLTNNLLQSQQRVKELNEELETARRQSLLDPLTNVANRRALEQRLAWQIKHSNETRARFCLVLADLDEFKKVNDNLGHQAGDAVLRAFAHTLQNETKGSDLVARYGGDEFAVILPSTEIAAAYNLMVRVKHKFEEMNTAASQFQGASTHATASFGIAAFKSNRSADDIVAAADMSLGRAKSLGRNRVCAEGFA